MNDATLNFLMATHRLRALADTVDRDGLERELIATLREFGIEPQSELGLSLGAALARFEPYLITALRQAADLREGKLVA